jgi:hypothetical protein
VWVVFGGIATVFEEPNVLRKCFLSVAPNTAATYDIVNSLFQLKLTFVTARKRAGNIVDFCTQQGGFAKRDGNLGAQQ